MTDRGETAQRPNCNVGRPYEQTDNVGCLAVTSASLSPSLSLSTWQFEVLALILCHGEMCVVLCVVVCHYFSFRHLKYF